MKSLSQQPESEIPKAKIFRGKPGQSLYEVFGTKPEESSAKAPISGRELIRKHINSNPFLKLQTELYQNLFRHFEWMSPISEVSRQMKQLQMIEDMNPLKETLKIQKQFQLIENINPLGRYVRLIREEQEEQKELADKIRDFLKSKKKRISDFLKRISDSISRFFLIPSNSPLIKKEEIKEPVQFKKKSKIEISPQIFLFLLIVALNSIG